MLAQAQPAATSANIETPQYQISNQHPAPDAVAAKIRRRQRSGKHDDQEEPTPEQQHEDERRHDSASTAV